MAKQEDMAKAFEAKTGIAVEVIPIDEKELGKRAINILLDKNKNQTVNYLAKSEIIERGSVHIVS